MSSKCIEQLAAPVLYKTTGLTLTVKITSQKNNLFSQAKAADSIEQNFKIIKPTLYHLLYQRLKILEWLCNNHEIKGTLWGL